MSDVAQPTAVVPPRTTKGKATRARLLTAASRLFAVQGYDGTSVEAVATEAGITVPGMYKHFPTKASLLLEVARRATITSVARQELTGVADLPGRLAALFAEYTADGQIERRRLSNELSRAAAQHPGLPAAPISLKAPPREP